MNDFRPTYAAYHLLPAALPPTLQPVRLGAGAVHSLSACLRAARRLLLFTLGRGGLLPHPATPYRPATAPSNKHTLWLLLWLPTALPPPVPGVDFLPLHLPPHRPAALPATLTRYTRTHTRLPHFHLPMYGACCARTNAAACQHRWIRSRTRFYYPHMCLPFILFNMLFSGLPPALPASLRVPPARHTVFICPFYDIQLFLDI